MKRKTAFSLAEALVTLLIVCVIAMVSAPVITSRARNHTPKDAWKINRERIQTVSPTSNRDIKLGYTENRGSQGIVVVGKLEFKNSNGETIGWIDENGNSSFGGSCENGGFQPAAIDQAALIQTIQSVFGEMYKKQMAEETKAGKNSRKPMLQSVPNANNIQMPSEEELNALVTNILSTMQKQ